MPAKTPCSSVAFLAVTRVADNAKLAVCFGKEVSNSGRKEFEGCMEALQNRANNLQYPGWKDSRCCDEERGADGGVVWALVDDQGICLLVAGLRGGETRYPDQVVLQLLRDLAQTVRSSFCDEKLIEALPASLASSIRRPMLDLMNSYADPTKKDKVREVQEQIDITKIKMHANIQNIIESVTTLEQLQVQSQSMSQRADEFCKQSVALKRQVQLRNLKVKVVIAGCVGAMMVYFMLPLVQN